MRAVTALQTLEVCNEQADIAAAILVPVRSHKIFVRLQILFDIGLHSLISDCDPVSHFRGQHL
jgi:hypothetical protein